MLFNFFRDRRRRKLLAAPWPDVWQQILIRNVPYFFRLPANLQTKARDIARIMVAEKYWEGCAGFQINEEVQVTIAAQAALLLLGMDHDYYQRVMTILVYPSAFLTTRPDENTDDAFVPDKAALGQAVFRGPVILAWDDVLAKGRRPEGGENVVIHEFAHQLDFLDNTVDGVPPLASEKDRQEWLTIMNQALEAHRQALAERRRSFFTDQTAESVTELFAYASEAFYCIPMDLAAEYPEVFRLLQNYYRVDPRQWQP